MASPVPLVPSTHLSEFGDLPTSATFLDAAGYDRDVTYTPGFSEMRRARDAKVAAYRAGHATLAEVRALDLPVSCRWARNQSKGGLPDNRKPFSHSRDGYRVATKDDVGAPWLTKLPGGAQVQADGSIRNGDTVLMVCGATDAARNVARKERETQNRLTGSVNAFAQNLQAAGVPNRGQDPYITKDAAPAVSPTKSKRET